MCLRQHPPATQVSVCCNKLLLTRDYGSLQIPPGEMGNTHSHPAPVVSPINKPFSACSFKGSCLQGQQELLLLSSFKHKLHVSVVQQKKALLPPAPHTTPSYHHTPQTSSWRVAYAFPLLIHPKFLYHKGPEGVKNPLSLRRNTVTLRCDPCMTWDTPPQQSPSLPPYTSPIHGKDTWLG